MGIVSRTPANADFVDCHSSKIVGMSIRTASKYETIRSLLFQSVRNSETIERLKTIPTAHLENL
jgi:hypothetical protein